MNILDDINLANTIFIDTAPIIYFIEKHSTYGKIVKKIIDFVQQKEKYILSSVLTLTEVLIKPVEKGDKILTEQFISFLKNEENLSLVEISIEIAEKAGKLRGEYPFIRTVDAIQIATAIEGTADIFITNDKKLRQIKKMKILILDDYLTI